MSRIMALLRRRYYLIIIAVVIVGVIIWRSQASAGQEYTYRLPERGDIAETLEVSTRVSAARIATLRFLAGGKVTYIGASEGDAVRKGQTIASVDARDLQKNLQRELNDYMSTRLTFEQDKDDYRDDIYKEEIRRLAQKSQLSLNNAVIDVELRDIAIRNASLYSPLDGILVRSPIDVAGVQVTATDTFQIVDPTSLQLITEVDEVDVGKVQSGMEARVILDAYPEETLTTTVGRVDISASASTRSSGSTVFLVYADIPSTDISKFRQGMNGTMDIVLRTSTDTLIVPIEAVSVRDGKSYVMVKTQNPKKPQEREVTTGIESATQIEIVSGLQPTDEIAIAK